MAFDGWRTAIGRVDPSLLQPQLLLAGREELLVEGYQKLLQYRETCMRLQLRGMVAVVEGEGLFVKCFAFDRVLLGGKIHRVTLEEDG